MATPQFNPNKPSGFGADDSTGERWINQGPWRFDPITKALLPGQIPEQSLGVPAPQGKSGGIEVPPLEEGASGEAAAVIIPPVEEVTDPGAAPAIAVTKDRVATPFDLERQPFENPLPEGKKGKGKK